jgi:cellulose synthase (UDP-forming)
MWRSCCSTSSPWAAIYVLVLGRVIVEAVIAPQQVKERLERRKAGARVARALPWPARNEDADQVVELAFESAEGRAVPAMKS